MTGGMDVGHDLGWALPQIAVLLTAVAALVAEMLRRPRVALTLTVSGLLIAAALALPHLDRGTAIFGGTYRVDTLSTWAVLILAPSAALAALLAAPEVRGSDREGTVYSLLSFTTLGALALSGAGDIMFLVLGVLLASLGSFALVAYPRDERATEAALKYFVFGTVTGGVMIFGLTYWFGATGSTLLTDLPRLRGMPLPAVAGLVAVLIGLGYKAALVPFHFGAPVAVAAYLSVVPKIGAIFGLAQVARSLPAGAADWPAAMAVLAVISMTYGNLAALGQDNVVRLLAYSSIAQAGYFLLGVIDVGHGSLAAQSLVVFAAAYAATNLGAFAVVARAGRDLAAYTGIGRASPWTGAAMTVFLLSLVGMPPLAGFAGKLLLFGAAIDAGYTWLAVVAILNSVLSLAVYLRIIVPMYRPAPGVTTLAPSASLVGGVTLLLTVALGVGVQAVIGRIG
jgi:NADH-quinone oxidoreductase subunit N